jgi:hypothetical protein
MYIFIDESGSFAFPPHGRRSFACVGALTVPESCYTEIVNGFLKLERSWGHKKPETKGRDLSEAEVAQTISLLLASGTKFHVCLTDMSWNTPMGVEMH